MKNMNKDTEKANERVAEGLSIANIPRGLSSALAADIRAMQVFSEMPDEPRNAFINGARNITDRAEMKRYVSDIRKK